jgi:hypothetical protein
MWDPEGADRAFRYKSGTGARPVLHRAFPCNPGYEIIRSRHEIDRY